MAFSAGLCSMIAHDQKQPQAPILTDLYAALVTEGAFAQAEQRLLDALNSGILSEYLSKFKLVESCISREYPT